MNKLNQLKHQYSDEVNNCLKLNKSKIIDSFVEYYGIEFRNIIENRYDEIVFTYFISPKFVDKLCYLRLFSMQKYYTEKILNSLGFNIASLDSDYILGDVTKDKNGQVKIFSSKINDVFNAELDIKLMKFIFGENGLFYTNKEDFSIISFENYIFGEELNEKQKEFLVNVFKTDELTIEIFNKIKMTIELIKKYILNYKRYEENSKLYYIVFELNKQFNNFSKTSKMFSFLDKKYNFHLKHVGSSDEFKIKNVDVEELLDENYNYGFAFQVDYANEDLYLRLISFSIFSGNIELFHEIGHALTNSDSKCKIIYDDSSSEEISKRGLCLTDEFNLKNTIALEEVINEKVTLDVIEIFNRKGGNILNSPLIEDIDNRYVKYYYRFAFFLINRFYDEFKEELKKARITENNNELILKCGKENYNALANIIYKVLEIIKVKWELFNASDYEFLLDEVNLIVDAMIINRDKQHVFSNTEMQEYYNELRMQGLKVTEVKDIENEMKR